MKKRSLELIAVADGYRGEENVLEVRRPALDGRTDGGVQEVAGVDDDKDKGGRVHHRNYRGPQPKPPGIGWVLRQIGPSMEGRVGAKSPETPGA